jgi:hypothetical protein
MCVCISDIELTQAYSLTKRSRMRMRMRVRMRFSMSMRSCVDLRSCVDVRVRVRVRRPDVLCEGVADVDAHAHAWSQLALCKSA